MGFGILALSGLDVRYDSRYRCCFCFGVSGVHGFWTNQSFMCFGVRGLVAFRFCGSAGVSRLLFRLRYTVQVFSMLSLT